MRKTKEDRLFRIYLKLYKAIPIPISKVDVVSEALWDALIKAYEKGWRDHKKSIEDEEHN